jgi:RNA polymerase sigma-70 factor (ECF subfamily)
VLLLVGLEGMSYRETADLVGSPIGTVMSRLSRARVALRNHLSPEPIALGSTEAMPERFAEAAHPS